MLLLVAVVKTETKMAVPIELKTCLNVLFTAVPCEILSKGNEFIPEVVTFIITKATPTILIAYKTIIMV